MQPDARGVRGIDHAHHRVQTLPAGLLDERGQKRLPHAAAPSRGIDVDGMLDRVTVRGERAKRAPGGESRQHARLEFDAQQRQAGRLLRGQPLLHERDAPRFVFVERGGVQDLVIVDAAKRFQMCLAAADHGMLSTE